VAPPPGPAAGAPKRSIWFAAVTNYPLLLILFAAAYAATGSLGLVFATVHRNVSPIWPATGLAIGVLFAGGLRFAPGVALGAIFVNVAAGMPPAVAAVVAIGNTFEGMAGALLLRRLSRVDRAVERVRDLPGLAAAVTVPPMISAIVGAMSLAVSGLIPWHQLPTIYAIWWRGDVLGALIVTPLVLEFRTARHSAWTRHSVVEAALLALGLTIVCIVVFAQAGIVRSRPLDYMVFPLLTWASWRFGPRGATVATMVVAVSAVWGTAWGFGPFATNWGAESVADLQVFLVVASATALLFGAATADRRRVEVAIIESEARRAALLRAIPDLMLRLGRNGVIRDCEVAHELAALPPPKPHVGRRLEGWLPSQAEEFSRHLALALETGALQTFAFVLPVIDSVTGSRGMPRREMDDASGGPLTGKAHHFEVRIVPSAPDEAVAILRDVTDRVIGEEERRSLERQFQESQKLESLGVLAGGIAHDFNNLLTTVLGNASLVRYELADDAPVQQFMEQIEASSRRAADLCRQLLAYAGKGRFVVEQLDLSSLVRDTTELLQLSISKSAVLRFDLATMLPAAQADATQVRQVLMNLVMNASDAIGDREGTIHLRTRAIKYSRGQFTGPIVPAEPPDGLYVAVEVQDDGCGIAAGLLGRVFEPFFTTKFTGRGLGLSAVLGIVRSHGGALHVQSESGVGSRFTLLLPATAMEVGRDEAVPAGPDAWHGSGTVLVVDDEQNVRLVAQQMLESLGFNVRVADHGAAGVDYFRRDRNGIRAVLLDVLMPGLDGHAVLREIRALDPNACVVLMSGFTEQAARVSDVAPPPVFLQKPFGRDQLKDALRRALETPVARAT
jgi:signal transduction histidine kinase/integral membrane sensor domain MASE1/CheY-like chemotaxis protein